MSIIVSRVCNFFSLYYCVSTLNSMCRRYMLHTCLLTKFPVPTPHYPVRTSTSFYLTPELPPSPPSSSSSSSSSPSSSPSLRLTSHTTPLPYHSFSSSIQKPRLVSVAIITHFTRSRFRNSQTCTLPRAEKVRDTHPHK